MWDGWVVAGVAQGGAGGVCPGGWPCPRHAVDHGEVQGFVGDFDVVAGAEEDQVVDVGGSVVGRGGEVVDVAQVTGHRAAGDDAADVAGVEGGFLGGGGEAVGAAQVQDGAGLVEDGAGAAGVAGGQGQGGGGEGPGVLGGAVAAATGAAAARSGHDGAVRD